MVLSTIRFMALGWVGDHFIKPTFHFHYFGFEWVSVLPPFWMYAIHVMIIITAFFVVIGLYFRASAILLFLLFTYTELIDVTYYLNHYYFITLVLFLLIFTPAHRHFSVDAKRNPVLATDHTPRLWLFIFQLLLAIVYTYAGFAKINYAWLIEALPLKIWLPANDTLPLMGKIFTWEITPYVFSWFGMLYDCTIVWWLMNSRTRPWAYATVIAFHILTGLLFNIGVFPWVMIVATLIFFSEQWHITLLTKLKRWLRYTDPVIVNAPNRVSRPVLLFFAIFFVFQLLFPWRYILYPSNLYWSEEGYRFSWRVMLMEKAGTATFYVKDPSTNKEGMVVNSEFLNSHQEKQMATQPDMILQFAHYLQSYYENQGMKNPSIRAEVYVTLNAQPSQLLIDPNINLAVIKDNWKTKTWILPISNE